MSFFLKVGRDGASKNAGEEVDSYSPAEYEGLRADNCITPACDVSQSSSTCASFVCLLFLYQRVYENIECSQKCFLFVCFFFLKRLSHIIRVYYFNVATGQI